MGSVMGGMLADLVRSYPALFGPNSSFGGANGVQWLERYPYALPMLANAVFLSFAAFCVGIGLEEVRLITNGPRVELIFGPDIGSVQRQTRLGCFHREDLRPRYPCCRSFFVPVVPASAFRRLRRGRPSVEQSPRSYRELRTGREGGQAAPQAHVAFPQTVDEERAVYAFGAGLLRFPDGVGSIILRALGTSTDQYSAFNNLWLLFLSSPRYDSNDPAAPAQRLPFIFTGGLGMLPQSVGFATAILGVIGMLLQFTVYPAINSRLGTAKSYQYFLTLFPLAYAFAPYIALAPSSAPPPGQANGPWVWFSIIVVLFLQVTARTFTLPTSIILLNNCSPHPSVLGTIHGIGQSVSSAFRTIGPIFSGSWYGYGLEIGTVGFAWWLIALVSVFGCVAAIFVYEGSGHEIILPGEEDEFNDRH